MEPIEIDLRNLSQEHLAQCKPFMGGCSYDDPCVIGTLIPPDRRHQVQYGPNKGAATVDEFIAAGLFIMPADQHEDAMDLQSSFDSQQWSEVERIASKYINAQAGEAQRAETTGSACEHAVSEADAPKTNLEPQP